MFRGNHPTRVDEKGRLKIPADFKRVVDELYTAEWQKKEELALNSRDVAVKRWLDRTSYYGQVAEMDAQGRVLIPQVLRESAKTVGDVVVFGKLNYLEVANHDLFRAKLEAEPLTEADEAALAALGL
jgi:MraZ protein